MWQSSTEDESDQQSTYSYKTVEIQPYSYITNTTDHREQTEHSLQANGNNNPTQVAQEFLQPAHESLDTTGNLIQLLQGPSTNEFIGKKYVL